MRGVALITVAAGLVYLFLFDPASGGRWPRCPFRAATGLYCPGCGSLRATHQLLHGNVAAALGLNPLMVLSLPFLAYAFLGEGMRLLGRRPPLAAPLPASMVWAFLGVIIAYWALRNLTFHPFTLLAP